MKLFFNWLKKTFYREISENPQAVENLINRLFFPLIFIFPIITLYINFPGEPELPFSPKKTYSFHGEPIIPIPASIKLNIKKVTVGKEIFLSTKLSSDDSVSCNTCHDLTQGGTIRKFVENKVNPPTVFNSGNYYRNEGMSEEDSSLIASLHLVHYPEEFGDYKNNLNKLINDPSIKNSLLQIYGKNLDISMVNDALKEFIISLSTPNGRFDKYLKGDQNSITEEEKEGFLLFKDIGCTSCHQGMNLGGNVTHKIGINGSYLRDKETKTNLDLGLFNKTGREEDKYKFKVPSLRNISITYPYLHDGRYNSLLEVIQKMSKYQLGKELTDEETKKIVKFLGTLGGELKGKILE